jgi:hypothetical protein
VVTRGPDGAEGIFDTPCHHRIHRLHRGARGESGGAQTVAIQGGIGVHSDDAVAWIDCRDLIHVLLWMDALESGGGDLDGILAAQMATPFTAPDSLVYRS